MTDSDVMALEQIAVNELMAHAHRWDGPALNDDTPRPGAAALDRLAGLGLVATSPGRGRVRGRIAITPAGVEALAYLSATA